MKKLLITAMLIFPLFLIILYTHNSLKNTKDGNIQMSKQKICLDGIEYYKIYFDKFGRYHDAIITPRIIHMDEHLNIATVVKCEEK